MDGNEPSTVTLTDGNNSLWAMRYPLDRALDKLMHTVTMNNG